MMLPSKLVKSWKLRPMNTHGDQGKTPCACWVVWPATHLTCDKTSTNRENFPAIIRGETAGSMKQKNRVFFWSLGCNVGRFRL